jgi:quinohemoprotein ethanol dehydrogenase
MTLFRLRGASRRLLFGLFIALLGGACTREAPPTAESRPAGGEPAETVEAAAVAVDNSGLGDETSGENWLAFGRTYSEQRFSPLDQVNTGSVERLAPAWYRDLPGARGLVSTPLVADGIMYFNESMNRVHAVDAATGDALWSFDPEVAEHTGTDLRVGWEHNRGIGLWKDKVYLATWDGRLIALDRATGEQAWSVRTFPKEDPLYITGAPKIFDGKVLVGNGGTEEGPNRGFVTAYDAETGDQIWRFWIVPGNPADGFENEAMRMAADTWTGEWWRFGGGGNAWHGFTYDAEFDRLYIGTGNGAPWNRKVRSPGGGDNLFLCSVVALDADTGEYVWHYQTVPGDTWDYNSNMDIVLADLEMEGRTVKALMHAPKNGFFYTIDRETGKPLVAEPFSEVTWATHVDLETGRPVEVPGQRYEDGGPVRVAPSPWGAHSWHAMSYNPITGLAYLPAIHFSIEFFDHGIDPETWESSRFEGDTIAVSFNLKEGDAPYMGSLQAIDPTTGRIEWEVPLAGKWNAGTLTTAGGLVFQGRADGDFVAYDAKTGDELWRRNLGLGISAPPITYAVDGTQYVSLLVGWGGGAAGIANNLEVEHGWAYGRHTRRLVAFSLEGDAVLPPQQPPAPARAVELAYFEVNADLAEQGAEEYGRCGGCHGPGAKSGGMAPDLRASAIVASAEAFADVVRGGSRMHNGMPRYAHLTDDQLLMLRHYLRREAEQALANLEE